MRVRFTTTAFAELHEIHDYIAKDNPTAARAVVLRVEQVIARIAQFSYRTRDRSVRCAGVPGRALSLSRVLHGRRRRGDCSKRAPWEPQACQITARKANLNALAESGSGKYRR